MKDLGAFETDMAVRGLEKRLTEIYSEASRDITRKMVDFQKKFEAKNAIHLKELKEGKITKDDYNAWLRGQVFQGNQWKAKKAQIEDTLYRANEQATNIINGQMTNVFATNANWMSYTMEHDAGVNFGFGLYDSATVANLVKNDPKILPEWKINEKKDYIWNSKKVNTQITQGILQGESLAKIADRLSENLVSHNKDKMLTFARTSMTCAQNAGRQESLNEAKEKGIDVEKEWMATLDDHTRDAHRDLDGQHVPLDEPFVVDGHEIMYPGDPNAEPFLVYNCRCTMVGNVGKYPAEYDRYDNINGEPIENMTYREWEEAKSGTQEPEPTEENIQEPTEDTVVTPEIASEDWFEYENANVMREYIQTGTMPNRDMYGEEIDEEKRKRLASGADLMQNIGSTTKTEYKTLYRGMVMDEDEVRNMFTPGEHYTFDTLSATTTDKGIANIYSNVENAGGEGVPVVLEIQKPDGIYGFDRDGIEVVIPKGSDFRILRNYMDEDGIVHISLYSKKGNNVS